MAANAVTIVAALLLSVVLVKVYLLPPQQLKSRATAPVAAVGTNMKGRLTGVDYQKNGRTLVLALSTQCHFCTESAPFFRKLSESARPNVKMVAVLPQSIPEGEQYLSGEGLQVDLVKQESLSRLGIRGTPTMLLVNGAGVVTKVWVGKLEAKQQQQVLSLLSGTATGTLIMPLAPVLCGRNP